MGARDLPASEEVPAVLGRTGAGAGGATLRLHVAPLVAPGEAARAPYLCGGGLGDGEEVLGGEPIVVAARDVAAGEWRRGRQEAEAAVPVCQRCIGIWTAWRAGACTVPAVAGRPLAFARPPAGAWGLRLGEFGGAGGRRRREGVKKKAGRRP